MATLLHAARDTAAMIYLTNELGTLREAMMERAVAGKSAGAAEWQAAEAAIYDAYRATFFAGEAAAALEAAGCLPLEAQDRVAADFQVFALVGVHRLLKAIPVIGDPACDA